MYSFLHAGQNKTKQTLEHEKEEKLQLIQLYKAN